MPFSINLNFSSLIFKTKYGYKTKITATTAHDTKIANNHKIILSGLHEDSINKIEMTEGHAISGKAIGKT